MNERNDPVALSQISSRRPGRAVCVHWSEAKAVPTKNCVRVEPVELGRQER